MESYYLLLLVALTSLLLYAGGRLVLGLRGRGLRPALARVLECAGLAILLTALNVAVGFVLVLAFRRLTGAFLSLYLNTDATLVALSLIQAVALQWWMREGEDG